MKLISLQLFNFRQFNGETPVILFSRKKTRNVTIIHAENGAGKTALLNAFIWVLYEKHTAGFLYPENLVNSRAIQLAKPDTRVYAWVELKFEHDEIKYSIKRTTAVHKMYDGEIKHFDETAVLLTFIRRDGTTGQADNIRDIIGRILPEDLHNYFFFDGERIEKIVNPDDKARRELSRATRKLLGLKAFKRAIDHLDNARKIFEKELKAVGDPETQNLLKRKEALEEQKNEFKHKMEMANNNLEAQQKIKQEIEERLRNITAARELQDRRDKLNAELEQIKHDRVLNRKKLQSAIAQKSYYFFLDQHIKQFNTIIEEKEAKGDLPSKYKKQFILDLIEMQECICGRSLDKQQDHAACQKVKAWLEKAALDGVDETIYTLRADLRKVPQAVAAFRDALRAYREQDDTGRTEEGKIESELEEIQEEMISCTQEDVAGLGKQLIRTEAEIAATRENIGKIGQQVENADQDIKELAKEINKHESKEEKQALIQRRIQATVEARDRFREVFDYQNVQLRIRLEHKVNKIFHKISFTDYRARLDDGFSLSLMDRSSVVPQSQGESQILSLSFIAGIVEVVREGFKDDYQNILSRDREYPIVMDSPFGALDTTNRRRVTEQINSIADQVVMLVSSSQWKDEVRQAAEKNLGKAYVLKYHTPKDKFKQNISITLQQRRYELVVKSYDEFEHTEIIEVKDE